MLNQFSRTELLIGAEALKKLNNSKVAIFGIGGVGSFVAEGLSRAGIGSFILIDNDNISITNLNRQLIALHSTIGKGKADEARKRILDINPNANVEIINEFFTPSSADFFDSSINYIVDAIDTITSKIELVDRAEKHNIPIISSMGTGNKMNPTKFEIADIYKTSMCPVAKILRKELKKRKIEKLKVVYSKEKPLKNYVVDETEYKGATNNRVPGSISFVPSVAGLIIAGEVIKDLIKND